jgi:hypothetical protein
VFALALVGPVQAGAAGVHVEITAPRANAVVGSDFTIRANVRPLRNRHTVSYYIDGRLVARQQRGTIAGSSRSATVRRSGLSRGTHTVRVIVRSGRKRAQSSVPVFVEPGGNDAIAKQSPAQNPPSPETTPGGEQVFANDPNVPAGNARDFQLIFADDFTKNAALGSFASDCDANKIVYTGASGTQWRAYPKCYLDTYQKRPYRSDQVLSVNNGNLDFWLHSVDGKPAGANPSPVLPNGSQYQTYGRWSARVKVDGSDLSEYYMAWLLWPRNESEWESAESDYPEGPLLPGRAGIDGYHHYSPGRQEWFGERSIDMHEWHTYTQDWTPLARRYYVDGRLVGTTVNPVYSGPQRWQLQTETKGYGNNSGHLLVDWVAVYQYAPGTAAQ